MIRLAELVTILVLCGAALAAPVLAHSTAATTAAALSEATTLTPSSKELVALVRTLQNRDERSKLITQIEGLIAAQKAAARHAVTAVPEPSKPLASSETLLALLSQQIRFVAAEISAIVEPASLASLAHRVGGIAMAPATRTLWLEGAATLGGVVGLALVAERATDAGLGIVRRRVRVTPSSSVWAKGAALSIEILLRWTAILVFLVAGYSLLALTAAIGPPQHVAHTCLLAILEARTLVRAIMIVAEASFARAAAGIGVFHSGEESADYWLVWLGRLVRFGCYSYFAVGAALNIGMTETVGMILVKALGLVFTGLLIMLLLQNRTAMATVIRGRESLRGGSAVRGLRRRIAETWHIAAVLYIAGGYGVWAADIPGGFSFLIKASVLSAVVLIAARLGALGGTRLANRMLAVPPALGRRLPDLQSRVNLYAPTLVRIARGLVYSIAGLLVLQIWGLDVMAWIASPAGLKFIGRILTVALATAAALVTWEVVGFIVNLYLAPGADGAPVERSARARTLLPLFRKTMAFFLSAAVALVLLSELGVNVAPLLAGAGIAGIAVGFGAQSLVKDVITGLFILMQDAVAVGDVVTVAGSSGLVEQISIRSIRLRGLDGTVILVPFSEVGTVHNMTKDFSYALFNIGISYREDVDEVIGVISALAEELRADPEYHWRILETIEVLGLDQFADSAVIIKARIKTKPIQQWNVMREYNRRLKRRFDELGIEMPFPHRTVYFGVDKKGDAPPAHIVASSGDETPTTDEQARTRELGLASR
jgi:moderate conductance mechanosensitive channel